MTYCLFSDANPGLGPFIFFKNSLIFQKNDLVVGKSRRLTGRRTGVLRTNKIVFAENDLVCRANDLVFSPDELVAGTVLAAPRSESASGGARARSRAQPTKADRRPSGDDAADRLRGTAGVAVATWTRRVVSRRRLPALWKSGKSDVQCGGESDCMGRGWGGVDADFGVWRD